MVRPAEFVYRFFWQSVDWIYPPRCVGCGQPDSIWCEACRKSVQEITSSFCPKCGYPRNEAEICRGCDRYCPQFTSVRSWSVYEKSVKEAIHALKYQNNLSVGSIFCESLVAVILREGWKPDAIVPIPLSKVRMKERGYNQAAILAYPVSLRLGVPMFQNLIQRTKTTESQVHLNHYERMANLQNAFSARYTHHKFRKVLIVDDVITTGSTINDCARAILESGAEEVYGISVARAVINDMAT